MKKSFFFLLLLPFYSQLRLAAAIGFRVIPPLRRYPRPLPPKGQPLPPPHRLFKNPPKVWLSIFPGQAIQKR